VTAVTDAIVFGQTFLLAVRWRFSLRDIFDVGRNVARHVTVRVYVRIPWEKKMKNFIHTGRETHMAKIDTRPARALQNGAS